MDEGAAIKVMIVEDEAVIALNIQNVLLTYGYHVLPPALNFKEAQALLAAQTPDIALLDINLQEQKTGLDLARLISSRHAIPFIFITANTDAATIARAAAVKPAAYLTKPFTKETLYASIQVALYNSRENADLPPAADIISRDNIHYFFVKIGNHFIKINYTDIAFIQFEGRYSMAYLANGKKYPLRTNLAAVENKLSTMGFVRISKSAVVNIGHVQSFTAEYAVVLGQSLAIGRNYKALFLQRMQKPL